MRLIAVTTCHARMHSQGDAQRNTWAKKREDVIFFLGCCPCNACGGLAKNEPHISLHYPCQRQLNVDDSYAGLPAKVRETVRWALANGYDSMLKLDDDVYLVPERLPNYEADYVGNFRDRNGNYHHAYASGFCYHLGKRAMEIIAGAELTADSMEDRWVGNVLGEARVSTFDEKRFACPYPNGVEDPKFLWGSPIGKTHIALAQYPADKFEQLHYWYQRSQGLQV